jgi:hypothetical protein
MLVEIVQVELFGVKLHHKNLIMVLWVPLSKHQQE